MVTNERTLAGLGRASVVIFALLSTSLLGLGSGAVVGFVFARLGVADALPMFSEIGATIGFLTGLISLARDRG